MHFKWNSAFSGVLASSVAAFVATTSLYAIPRDPCEPPVQQVCCEEPKPGPFAFAYPFDMDLNCPKDFYIHVDGLAFQAKQDGMEFVIQDSSTPTDSNSITQGRVRGFSGNGHDYDYNPGFRVGIGFYLDHDAWNVDFNWTWLNITNYEHANATTSGGVVIPLNSLGVGTPGAQIGPRSSSCWDSSYDTIDVRLGKPYYVSRYLVVNPHFGLRGGWIDQHVSADYSGDGADTRTIMHADNNFWGIGTRAGLDTDWILGKGWCLFGNIAASMLFGKFEISQNYILPGAEADGYDIRHDYYQNTPNLEMAIGIGWGMYFNKKRNHVGLKAGYEFHEWFDQLNLRKFFSGSTGTGSAGPGTYANDVVSRGNLTLNGFSLRLQFDI
ncbi:MAG: Lpg1974 family pore-forming outer membrane protein [Chlamydiales bacterium]